MEVAMNPILPRKYFTPDVEARVMPDGKLYLYGSQDISGDPAYCSKKYHVFVTEDPKLEQWADCGVSFQNYAENPGIPWSPDTILYAPDAIHKDGKYYLYICGENNFEGVAEADCPAGPFGNAKAIEGADGRSIDPSIFVDDDGQAYYFWGQFRLMGAKMNPDMASLDMDTLNTSLLTEMEHGFHEGASIRKRNGKYYMVYTDVVRGRATCLSYAMADSPLGPYKKCGVIIDNVYCDPSSWNNHGSIAEFKGQWYVFYHRSSQNKMTCRRVCAEPIFFDENGLIAEVCQTSQGTSAPFKKSTPIPSRSACRMMRSPRIDICNGKEMLFSPGEGYWKFTDWAEYKYVDFDSDGVNSVSVKVKGVGKITVVIEDNEILGSLSFDSDNFDTVTAQLKKACGVHTVWLILDGNFIVDEFCFE